jgi:acid stress-induced BolA-like protein IbaG/YrbA
MNESPAHAGLSVCVDARALPCASHWILRETNLGLAIPSNGPIIVFMQPEDIKQLIERGLPGAQVNVSGDGHHFEASIVARQFAGKSVLQQHQMVYATLGDKMRSEIHALSLRTLIPEA